MKGPFTRELEIASRLARDAASIILEVYRRDFDVVEKPGGGGPVTLADKLANERIVAGLRAAFPGDGVVAEESEDNSDTTRFERCWFVDPLDGTKEFVKRNDQFAIHIGLAVAGDAKVGVVYQPVTGSLHAGVVGEGCALEVGGTRHELRMPPEPHQPLRIVVSRSHRSERLASLCDALGIEQVQHMGSVGIKCGMVAEGQADLYVHPSRMSFRWDACAPEAIVRAAGGFFGDLAGQRFRYDEPELQNLRGLLACHPAVLDRVLPVLAQVGRDAKILP